MEDILVDRGTRSMPPRCSDPMRYPNTVDAEGLLRRRQYKSLPETTQDCLAHQQHDCQQLKGQQQQEHTTTADGEVATNTTMDEMMDTKLFDGSLFHEMMRDKGLGDGFDAMIVYSLRWNEGSSFYVYVIPAGEAYQETVHVRKLTLTTAVKSVLCTESALMQRLHPALLEEDECVESATESRRSMIPYDTPLFPQRHMFENFQLPQTDPSLHSELRTNLALSLSSLYDCFIQPIEDLLPPKGSTLLFVGDGIINCIPFHALLKSPPTAASEEEYVMDSYHSTKVPSVQHALTIYSRRRALADAKHTSTTAASVNFVTAAEATDAARQSLMQCPRHLRTSRGNGESSRRPCSRSH